MKYIPIFIFLITVAFPSTFTYSHETVVVGQVFDAATGNAISNVNVFFKQTTWGTKTNDEGFFMLRATGNVTSIVFSSVGYVTKEYPIEPGKPLGLQVMLQEQTTQLQDLFVLPGLNPANEFMKRVRKAKSQNNIRAFTNFSSNVTTQSLVLLHQKATERMSKKMFNQLSSASVDSADSKFTIPLYLSEVNKTITANTSIENYRNYFKTQEENKQIFEKLMSNAFFHINVYQNTLMLFDKEAISPLSNIGNAFYRYIIADSLVVENAKQYVVEFRSLNPKQLAFNGHMYIDSSSLALTHIEMELPTSANLNYVQRLKITQQFKYNAILNRWLPNAGLYSVALSQQFKIAQIQHPTALFLQIKQRFSDVELDASSNFAGSSHSTESLNKHLDNFNQTPLMRTARWIADVVLTGNARFGKIDIGKVYNVARITQPEGLNLTLPFRTNERLWLNSSVGGSIGYGFKNQQWVYSGFAETRLPALHKHIVGVSYANDYRSIDYDYNDFALRENPLLSGDEDISNTLFGFRTSTYVSKRREFSMWLKSDWTPDFSSYSFYRSITFYPFNFISLANEDANFNSIHQQSLSITTRFSSNQRSYTDHLQRIYAQTNEPVLHITAQAAKYALGQTQGFYGKLQATLSQQLHLGVGVLNYKFKSGAFVGSVPFSLLKIPYGSESNIFNSSQFSCMNYFEYVADKYLELHADVQLNGIFLNTIPFLKQLNLREMMSYKMFYGGLSHKHTNVIPIPAGIQATETPYAEIGVGISNIFRLFTLQSVWRLTDANVLAKRKWALLLGLKLGF